MQALWHSSGMQFEGAGRRIDGKSKTIEVGRGEDPRGRTSGSADQRWMDGAPTPEEPRPDTSNARSQRPATRAIGVSRALACVLKRPWFRGSRAVVAHRCFAKLQIVCTAPVIRPVRVHKYIPGRQVSPCTCLTPIWHISPKDQFALRKYQRGLCGVIRLYWAKLPHSFAEGGREGHCEHVGALVSVIYNASTRPMVIDSMHRGPYKQPIQVSERGQYWYRRTGCSFG
jgi:hypothetical protein